MQLFKLQMFLWVYLCLENFYKTLQKSVQIEIEGQFLKKVMHTFFGRSSSVRAVMCIWFTVEGTRYVAFITH